MNRDAGFNNPTRNPEIYNSQYIQQSTPQSTINNRSKSAISKIILRILTVIFAITIILIGLLNLKIILIQLKDIFGNLNQLIYRAKYVNLEGIINIIQYFSSKLLTTIFSILFIIAGFLIMMNKPRGKKVFLIAIFIIILQIVLSLVFSIYSYREQKKSDEEYQKWREEIKTVDRSTVTDLRTIWALKDPQLCKNIKYYYTRKNCITVFKDEKLFTIDYCTDISSDYDKNMCFSDVAEIRKDKNICYTIPDEFRKNYCLAGVATKLKDETLCNEVSEISNLHNTCVINIGIELRDTSYCEKANDQVGKDNCYDNIATYTHDRSLCDKIINPVYKQGCIEKTK
jgi:flagellar basal body-associated protein FliL